MIVDDGVIVKMFVEPLATPEDGDPYGETTPENILEFLGDK